MIREAFCGKDLFELLLCWNFLIVVSYLSNIKLLLIAVVRLHACLDKVRDPGLSVRYQVISDGSLNHGVLITDSLMLT